MPTSKQRQWQLRKAAEGLCVGCGKVSTSTQRCEECRIKNREASRNTYRRRHGIPLDAPKLLPGRPCINPNA